jgi:hypothetical protein
MKHGRHVLVGHVPSCMCGLLGTYSEYWDTYYCKTSGVWLEGTCNCTEETCIFKARNRPEVYPLDGDKK